jgi:hypothetical protein
MDLVSIIGRDAGHDLEFASPFHLSDDPSELGRSFPGMKWSCEFQVVVEPFGLAGF